MKKKEQLRAPRPKERGKRRFLLLSLFATILLGATSPAQARGVTAPDSVTFKSRQMTVEQVIDAITDQLKYAIFYNDAFDDKRVVRLPASKMSLGEVLRLLLNDAFTYKIEGHTVVITPAPRQNNTNTPDHRIISGIVKEEHGLPLPGVNVRVEGTTMGVSTDAEGRFVLALPAGTTALTFSFIGMVTQTMNVEKRKPGESLTVVMKEEVAELDDVVVTGYANIRKSSFTGTSTKVTREELLKVSTGNVLQALQVFDPSLRTVRNNEMGSDPNTLPEFNIRGAAGIGITELDRIESTNVSQFALKNNPNLPVFILDGYEVSTEKIYDMDPNRIESITILKDAAATAMYGSRAANGVIVIETVAPQAGKLRITYNLTGSVTAPDLSSYDMMNAREKLDLEVAGGLLQESDPNYNNNVDEYQQKLNYILLGVDTYWLSQPLRTEVNHRHSLYVEGGEESVRFGLGLNYAADGGVMKKSYRDRMGAELKVDYRIKGLQITNNVSFTRMKSQQSPYGVFSTYVRMQPYLPAYNLITGEAIESYIDGSGMFNSQLGKYVNPLIDVLKSNFDRSGYDQYANNLSVNAWFLDYFQLKFQFSVTNTSNTREVYTDPRSSTSDSRTPFTKGELEIQKSQQTTWNSNLMLMYNRYINHHNLNLNLILNANEDKMKSEQTHYRGFAQPQFHDPQYAYELVTSPVFSDDHSRLMGTSLQGNYTYKDTYLFDLSLRRDGSSKFGSKQRFGSFWSFGTGLNLHNYPFMQAYPFVQTARIKANYGETGRTSFPPYASQNRYRLMLDEWYTTGTGSALIAMGNEALTWDKVNTINIGVDLNVGNRLVFNFSYYDKRTHDMVTDLTIPSATGFTAYMDNVGEVSNKGYEWNVNVAVVKQAGWSVNVGANGAHNVNRIEKLSNALKEYNDRVDAFYNDYYYFDPDFPYDSRNEKFLNPIRKYYEGGSEYAILGMKSLGISPENGAELFMNRDGSVTYDWDAAQQNVIGNTEPTMQGAFFLNARYKSFSLYTTFTYEFGGDLYNSTLVSNVESIDIRMNNTDRRAMTQRWQKPGDRMPYKSIRDRYTFTLPTSRFVQKNNTLSFNSLTVGYDMDRNLTQRLGLSMLRFQFSMNDIAVFSTIHQERGTSYPFARKFGFTLNAGF